MVQHSPDLTNAQDICSLLQVRPKVNAALRQCKGHVLIHTSVNSAYSGAYTRRALHNEVISKPWAFAGFAAWLPKHAGLVKAITMRKHTPMHRYSDNDSPGSRALRDPEFLQSRMVNETGRQLLELALQLSTTSRPQAWFHICDSYPVAAAAAGRQLAVAASALPPLLLQLQSFDTEHMLSTEAVATLAAAKVTHLSMPYGDTAADVTPSFCAAVQQLTTLRQLNVSNQQYPLGWGGWHHGPGIPDMLPQAIG